MTTWTAPATAVPGGLTSAYLNTNVRDNPSYLYEVVHGTNADKIPFAALDPTSAWPQCHVALVSAWVMANNAETAINYSATERWDTAAMHDPATNNTRITPTVKGIYLCYATLAFPANATGRRYTAIRRNGATTIGRSEANAGASVPLAQVVAVPYQFNGTTDYAEHVYFQDSGGGLTSPAVGNFSSEFGLVFIGGY